jgi:hypothetical protein
VKAARDLRYRGLWNLEIPGERLGPEPFVTARMKYALAVARTMVRREFAA